MERLAVMLSICVTGYPGRKPAISTTQVLLRSPENVQAAGRLLYCTGVWRAFGSRNVNGTELTAS
jgi:hypothetical protein